MNTEETIFRNEKTQFSEVNDPTNASSEGIPPQLPQKKGTWRTIAIGGATGLVFGAGTAVLTSMVLPDGEQTPEGEIKTDSPGVKPDPEIHNATSVSDDMSFADAFATARAEVGPGGTFQWHGQLYNTYTVEEWDQLNPNQQDEYNNHFAIVDDKPEQPVEPADNGNEVILEVIDNPVVPGDDDIVDIGGEDDYEIEILGVVNDAETGMNTGVMTVDGQAVILVDVDGDEVFDLAATDANANGQIDDDEILDISDQNITVGHLGGYIDNSSQFAENNDEPDYVNDADINA